MSGPKMPLQPQAATLAADIVYPEFTKEMRQLSKSTCQIFSHVSGWSAWYGAI